MPHDLQCSDVRVSKKGAFGCRWSHHRYTKLDHLLECGLKGQCQNRVLGCCYNDLDKMSEDIGYAYLNAPNKKKIWTIAGHEFGTDKGVVFIITRALYGLKLAGAAWRAFFAQALTTPESSLCVVMGMSTSSHKRNPMGTGTMKCYWYMLMIYSSYPMIPSPSLTALLHKFAP